MIRTKINHLIGSCALALSTIATGGVAHAAVLSVTPSTATTAPGGALSLSIDISGAVDLYAYQLDVAFNPSVLRADTVGPGSFFAPGSVGFSPGNINNAAGSISFIFDSLSGSVSGLNGNGALAIMNFTGLAGGTSPVNLSNVLLLNSSLNTIAGTTFSNGMVTVSGSPGGPGNEVPEPSMYALLALAAAALVAAKKTGYVPSA